MSPAQLAQMDALHQADTFAPILGILGVVGFMVVLVSTSYWLRRQSGRFKAWVNLVAIALLVLCGLAWCLMRLGPWLLGMR